MGANNPEAQKRLRIARFLKRCLDDMEVPAERVEADLGLPAGRASDLLTVMPQLGVLHPIGAYVERLSKQEQRSQEGPLDPLLGPSFPEEGDEGGGTLDGPC